MKTVSKRIISIALLLVLLLSMSAEVFAANVCQNITGSSKKASTFYVETGSRLLFSDKLTLTQTQGKFEAGFTFLSGKCYWAYTLKIQKLDSKGKVISEETKKWNYSKDYTLKLNKNSTYRITITPVSEQTVRTKYLVRTWGYDILEYPKWSIKSTKGINLCR